MFLRIATGLVVLAVLGWLLAAGAGPVWASAPAEGGHASEGAGLNPITWQTETAIWTAVVFVLLLLVLSKFAWKPIVQGLQKRERAIADQIAQAESSNQKAKEVLAEYQQKLSHSEQEVRRMIEQARRDAEEAGRALLDKAREDAQAEHRKAVRDIEAATAQALKELSERSAGLAVELAGKILAAELKPGDHAKLIQESVAGFAKAAAPSKN